MNRERRKGIFQRNLSNETCSGHRACETRLAAVRHSAPGPPSVAYV